MKIYSKFFIRHLAAASIACLALMLSRSEAAEKPIDVSPIAAKDGGSALQEGWQHGAFMEIFVRAYKDSNGDGIGDLNGVIQKLDYLKDLGVKGIWLMPITQSADRDHGYATTDFRDVETDYGTLADFDELLKQAHARGIGVIMDYVVNHSAASHPLFVQSASNDKNKYRDWFVWQGAASEKTKGWEIWGKNPWIPSPEAGSPAMYFATFGFHMPDFNMRNPAVINFHKDSLRFWLNRGIDGFRLDAVPHLVENNAVDWNDQPESRVLTKELTELIRTYARRHVVCEATANPQAYAAPEICGSAFAFGHQYNIVKAAQGDVAAIQLVADYFKTAPLTMATMLSNHDIFAGERLWDQLRGNVAQYKIAAATYLLQPGTPFIYYGEEIGMAGAKEFTVGPHKGKKLNGDEPLRAPMSWTANIKGFTDGKPFRPVSPNARLHNAASEAANPNSIFTFYKTMINIRNTRPSIARGSYEASFVDGSVMGYKRKLGDEQTLVLTNFGTSATTVNVKNLPANATLTFVYPNSEKKLMSDVGGNVVVAMKPESVIVLSVSK